MIKMNNNDYLSNTSSDIQTHVLFEYLDTNDLCKLRQVSRIYTDLIYNAKLIFEINKVENGLQIIKRFSKAKLIIITSHQNNFNDDDLQLFTKNLTSLDLGNNSKITDNGLEGLKNLTSLDLSHNSTITDKGLEGLKNLTSLNLYDNSTITDKGLEGLKNLTSIKR
jgi:Leucine-rich repeat (LRR) protein